MVNASKRLVEITTNTSMFGPDEITLTMLNLEKIASFTTNLNEVSTDNPATLKLGSLFLLLFCLCEGVRSLVGYDLSGIFSRPFQGITDLRGCSDRTLLYYV